MRRNAIRDFREFLKVNQAEFGALFGYHQSIISMYECGRRPVSLKVARRLVAHAKHIGYPLTLDDIYREDNCDTMEKTDD